MVEKDRIFIIKEASALSFSKNRRVR